MRASTSARRESSITAPDYLSRPASHESPPTPALTGAVVSSHAREEGWHDMSQLRSVGLLAAGTAVAHVVGLAAAPLLTRLYTPTEFGLLAVFTSIVGIASVVVSLRLELAVPVPPAEEDAAQVVAAGMVVAAVVAGLVAVLVAALGDEVSAALGVPELAPLL